MSTLTLSNVSYTYKNAANPAVSGVSCTFEADTLYAIVGPSGSGKSTLLSMLAGLDLPGGGEIRIGEENLTKLDLDKYRREKISMIFQAYHLLPLLTVLENVCYPLELTGITPKEARLKAAKLLECVGITKEQMKRFPGKLSDGEQQRVAIARSLVTGARIILADEPTGNLDIANTKNIMEILQKLAHEEGYCVIVVTHDLDIAEMADMIYQMRDGILTELWR